MILTTRDAQRERRSSYIFATALAAENGMTNVSFHSDFSYDTRRPSAVSRVDFGPEVHQEQPSNETNTDQERETRSPKKHHYHWRMTYYFYIHVAWFAISGLLCGLIVWLIENYSSFRNNQVNVEYIDAWFVSSSCVSSCGLTSMDFAKLSTPSHMVLMFFTFVSGVTISTLPALIVKAHTHKRVEGITVDDDHGELDDIEAGLDSDHLPTINIRRERSLPEHIQQKLHQLPTAAQLRYRAYIACIILILATCFIIYTIIFVGIGCWLAEKYTADQLLQGNSSVNPWYVSFIITMTGFNQNGLSPFSDGLARFVSDVYFNLFVMVLVMSGTSLFPVILRTVVQVVDWFAPWQHKVLFDYILLNNHRLSTLLFPEVQTRIYLLVTVLLFILGVGISLILDLNSSNFASYPPGIRFLIFAFHTINARFAGFQTIDINTMAAATLVVYLLLMATKPQMLCAIDESPFELSWLALQAKEEASADANSIINVTRESNAPGNLPQRGSLHSTSTGTGGIPIRHMERFLRRQSLVTKNLARQQFANTLQTHGQITHTPRRLTYLRTRLFLIYFARSLIKHTISFVILTRTWLFFFIFLICAIEYKRMHPVDPNMTVFRVIFEIISAFGTVGLTMGYPNVSSSFSTVLSPASKIIIILTMLMGRHRGLLASMKDQEAIEHSAADLLKQRRDEIIQKYLQSMSDNEPVQESTTF